jgi:hypothetical protein
MIVVPVRDDQMVDLGETGILDGRHDSLCVPDRRLRPDITGIDEQGFTGRRNE